jgi:transcriptional regulator with XRE-family HTH domain
MTALHTDEYRHFSAALAEARRAAGLSQYDLADRLGVSQDFISKYEGGRRRLDVIEFLRIVHAIGVDPAIFLRSLSPDVGSFKAKS